MTNGSSRLTLDVLITDDRKVLIQVLTDPEESNGPRVAVWTATFVDPHTSDDEEESAPAWSPDADDPVQQIGKAVGRVIDLRQHREYNQLSMLLHLALHNLLDAAKSILKEG